MATAEEIKKAADRIVDGRVVEVIEGATDVRPFEVRFDYNGWLAFKALVVQARGSLLRQCAAADEVVFGSDIEVVLDPLVELVEKLERNAMGVVCVARKLE